MSIIYSFEKILKKGNIDKLQCKVLSIRIFKNITSLILVDVNDCRMELLSFGSKMKKLRRMEKNKWYLIRNLIAVDNDNLRYKKTNHCCKLIIHNENVTFVKVNDILKEKNGKLVTVVDINKNKKKEKRNSTQLSLLNFVIRSDDS